MLAANPFRLRRLLIAALAAVAVAHAQPVMANTEADTSAEQASPVFSLQSILMQGVVNRALQHIGVPYRFGGSNPKSGFDCSGLVNHVYREALGVALPRTSRQLASVGTPVAATDLRPGDLVFFNTRGAANSHVGIYLGDGRFVHAPRARTLVRIDRLDDPGYVNIFEGARRLDPLSIVMSSADPRI
ncbi:MAG: NlpC/P60 family protein [Gammaproteobacteria bacterium]|nr:NlpC/P60 family protein [Gammaproteobacteria bacterium]